MARKLLATPRGCPKCGDLQKKKRRTSKHNSVECRKRMHLCYEENSDPKFQAIRHLIEPSKPEEVRVDQDELPVPGHHPAAAQSSDAPCKNSRETEPNTQEADDHAAGYETPEPYDVHDLSDSDGDEEMQTEDQMAGSCIIAGADPNFAKTHVQHVLQVDSQKPTTFMEIYGGEAICQKANRSRRRLRVKSIATLDLKTCKDDGTM